LVATDVRAFKRWLFLAIRMSSAFDRTIPH
jgi:hypothetical protein